MGASSRSPSPITTVPSIGRDIEGGAHRFDRGLVGGMFVAAADLGGGGDGGGFGDAHRFQRKGAIQRFALEWGADQGHVISMARCGLGQRLIGCVAQRLLGAAGRCSRGLHGNHAGTRAHLVRGGDRLQGAFDRALVRFHG